MKPDLSFEPFGNSPENVLAITQLIFLKVVAESGQSGHDIIHLWTQSRATCELSLQSLNPLHVSSGISPSSQGHIRQVWTGE